MTSYRFVDGIFECVTEVKHSKFIATIFGEAGQDSAEQFVAKIKKKYPDATHNCFAYVSDMLGNVRFSDDGEPCGTAGQPILEVLQKQKLVCTAVVVTRYFGGIKLGASGLVGAYTNAVAEVLKRATIAEKSEFVGLSCEVNFSRFSQIENWLRKNTLLEDVTFDSNVRFKAFVEADTVESAVGELQSRTAGEIEIVAGEKQFKTRNNQC